MKKKDYIKKIQLALALLLTVGLTIAIPVVAWFHHEREIARMHKIKEPDQLYINAAHGEDSLYFKIDGIDFNQMDEQSDTNTWDYRYYIFSVSGKDAESFTLQMSHTTNNQFTYEIYEAERLISAPVGKVKGKDYITYTQNSTFAEGAPEFQPVVEQVDGVSQNAKLLYYRPKVENGIEVKLESDVELDDNNHSGDKYLNQTVVGNETIGIAEANNLYFTNTYDDDYQILDKYVMPLYWQRTQIPTGYDATTKAPFLKEYILKVSWNSDIINAHKKDGYYLKETDIVYLMVKAD